MNPPILWEPSPERIASATITHYREWLNESRGLELAGYHDLWQWSVDELEEFWASIWEFFDVRASQPYERVLTSRAMPGAEWFPGARLSYAEHIFRDRDDDAIAISHASELRPLDDWTWGELRARAGAVAATLRESGVEAGDRVAAYLPNIPETIAAFLGCASIGAVWSSCAPEFGVRSVVDRFAQIEPKVLLAVDGYRYGGKDFDRTDAVSSLEQELPTLERTLVLPYLAGGDWDLPAAELEFAQLPFDHPLWVLYSSGTTGLPKAIVHGQGGILLEHLKKLRLHLDARAGDRVFWFTTTGWMMWNFLVGALLSEASDRPLRRQSGVSESRHALGSRRRRGDHMLRDERRLHRVVPEGRSQADAPAATSPGSTASARPVRRSRPRASTGCATSSAPTRGSSLRPAAPTSARRSSAVCRPCRSTAASCRRAALGAKVESWSEDGRSLVGEVGELVITEPMPSMPLYLWGDGDGSRYRESYFSTFPGVWRHGDWIEITERGTAIITGRSDATINRGGVRMGTSELYRSVLALEEVIDALVVDVPQEDSSRMSLFVVLREGAMLDDALLGEIKRRIREDCSPRHVPDEIVAAPAIPRTLSGKILEVPVKRLLTGAPAAEVASRDSLANPEALDWFARFAGH